MGVHELKDIDTYARYLQENPAEVHILFKELLINVTSFFRDKEAFEALAKEVLPRLFAGKPENYTFRVWVPAALPVKRRIRLPCSSASTWTRSNRNIGSRSMQPISMTMRLRLPGQAYTRQILPSMFSRRLRRFFVKEEHGYRIKKEIREMVVFAIQNVIRDPPFTRMDLISLPEPADLSGTRSPDPGYPGLPLRAPPRRGAVPEPIGRYRQFYRSLYPDRQEVEDLCGKTISCFARALVPNALRGPATKTGPPGEARAEKTRNFAELVTCAPPVLCPPVRHHR